MANTPIQYGTIIKTTPFTDIELPHHREYQKKISADDINKRFAKIEEMLVDLQALSLDIQKQQNATIQNYIEQHAIVQNMAEKNSHNDQNHQQLFSILEILNEDIQFLKENMSSMQYSLEQMETQWDQWETFIKDLEYNQQTQLQQVQVVQPYEERIDPDQGETITKDSKANTTEMAHNRIDDMERLLQLEENIHNELKQPITETSLQTEKAEKKHSNPYDGWSSSEPEQAVLGLGNRDIDSTEEEIHKESNFFSNELEENIESIILEEDRSLGKGFETLFDNETVDDLYNDNVESDENDTQDSENLEQLLEEGLDDDSLFRNTEDIPNNSDDLNMDSKELKSTFDGEALNNAEWDLLESEKNAHADGKADKNTNDLPEDSFIFLAELEKNLVVEGAEINPIVENDMNNNFHEELELSINSEAIDFIFDESYPETPENINSTITDILADWQNMQEQPTEPNTRPNSNIDYQQEKDKQALNRFQVETQKSGNEDFGDEEISEDEFITFDLDHPANETFSVISGTQSKESEGSNLLDKQVELDDGVVEQTITNSPNNSMQNSWPGTLSNLETEKQENIEALDIDEMISNLDDGQDSLVLSYTQKSFPKLPQEPKKPQKQPTNQQLNEASTYLDNKQNLTDQAFEILNEQQLTPSAQNEQLDNEISQLLIELGNPESSDSSSLKNGDNNNQHPESSLQYLEIPTDPLEVPKSPNTDYLEEPELLKSYREQALQIEPNSSPIKDIPHFAISPSTELLCNQLAVHSSFINVPDDLFESIPKQIENPIEADNSNIIISEENLFQTFDDDDEIAEIIQVDNIEKDEGIPVLNLDLSTIENDFLLDDEYDDSDIQITEKEEI